MNSTASYREQVRAQIKNRGRRKYNVWTVFGSKVAEQFSVNTTARADNVIWMEADPDILGYQLPVQVQACPEQHSQSPDAICVMKNGRIEWRYVRSKADIGHADLFAEERRQANAYNASVRVVTIEELDRKRTLIENWRLGLAYLQAATQYSLSPHIARIELLLEAESAVSIDTVLAAYPTVNSELLLAAIFKLAQSGAIYTDFSSRGVSRDSRIVRSPIASKMAAGSENDARSLPLLDCTGAASPTTGVNLQVFSERHDEQIADEEVTFENSKASQPVASGGNWPTPALISTLSKRLSRRNIPVSNSHLASWAEPDTSSWEPAEVRRYQKMHDAMVDYIKGLKTRDVERIYNVRISSVMKQVYRAVQDDGAGEMLGFCALVPRLRTGGHARHSPLPSGSLPTGPQCTGGLNYILRKEDLYESLVDQVLKRGPGPFRTLTSCRDIQKFIISILKARGYKDSEYPLNTEDQLYSSLSRLISDIKHDHARENALANASPIVASNVDVASGRLTRQPRPQFLTDVEADEHKLHGIGSVTITLDGLDKVIPVERATGIVIVDRGSGAILGASISLSIEAKEQSLIEALSSALVPGYIVELPSGVAAQPFRACDFIPEIAGAAWSTMRLDNAKIHTANLYLDTASRVGFQTCWGPVASWSGRPAIESVFSRLVCSYFAKLPSTTGGGTSYHASPFPAEQAVKWNISLEMLCRLFYQALAEINTTCGVTRLNQSRIQVLADYVRGIRRPLIRKIPPPTANSPPVGFIAVLVPVKRRSHTNKNMYINYQGAKYTNERLSQRTDLLNEDVVVHVGASLRTLNCFERHGRPLGVLEADAPWGQNEHTAEIRRLAKEIPTASGFELPQVESIIQEVLDVQARKVLHANERRKKGSIPKGGLKLCRLMQATGAEEVAVHTKGDPTQSSRLTTTSSAAAFLRLARQARQTVSEDTNEDQR